MTQVPFHLQYTLNRRQRLVPHVRIWGVLLTLLVPSLFLFFCTMAVVKACSLDWLNLVGFGALALGLFALFRSLLIGLGDVLLIRSRRMDVIIEENAAGVLLGKERWYLFLDGINRIDRLHPDVRTLQHFNGCILHIAAAAISEEQLDHIRQAMERGQTPAGIQAVIERGRRIRESEEGERGR